MNNCICMVLLLFIRNDCGRVYRWRWFKVSSAHWHLKWAHHIALWYIDNSVHTVHLPRIDISQRTHVHQSVSIHRPNHLPIRKSYQVRRNVEENTTRSVISTIETVINFVVGIVLSVDESHVRQIAANIRAHCKTVLLIDSTRRDLTPWSACA